MIRIGASILVFLFYGAYFLKQMLLRRKGIQSNRLAKGAKSKKTMMVENCLLTLTMIMASMQYLSINYIEPAFRSHFTITLGFACLLLSNFMFISAIISMKDNWRAGVEENQNTSIVTNGIYRWSRNPAFVGFDLLYIGTALLFPNVFILIGVIVAVVFFHLQILEEEKMLPKLFGDEYEQYKKQTPRYLLFL